MDGSQDLVFARTGGPDRRVYPEAGQLAEVAWLGGLPRHEESSGGIKATDPKRPRLEYREFKLPVFLSCVLKILLYRFHCDVTTSSLSPYGNRYINTPPLFYEGGASSAVKGPSQLQVVNECISYHLESLS